MDFNSEVGKEIIQLIKYWQEVGENPDYRLTKVMKGEPNFARATVMEKKVLPMIKKSLSEDEWNNLPEIFKQAQKHLVNINRKNLEEYNRMLRREGIEVKQKGISREDAGRKSEEEKRKRAQQQKEQRLLSSRSKAEEINRQRIQIQLEEEQRRKQEELNLIKKQQTEEKEKKKTYKYLENLFENNYLESRRIWRDNPSDISEEELVTMSAGYIQKWFESKGWQIPDHEQAKCIAEVWDDIQVTARAGSGKTSTIVNRAAYLVEHCGISPSEILILAFNREAAKELNDRLAKMLGDNKPQAMTFHALAHGIVHPEEALIFDAEESGFSKSKSIQQVIDSYIKDPTWLQRISELMLRYFRSDWLEIEKGGYLLEPEEMVQYRRSIPYIGLDGVFYKSMGEKRLADYLFEHNVSYVYEKNFWWEKRNYKPDFTIALKSHLVKGLVIEYFGMTGDPAYDRLTKEKQSFWKEKFDYEFIPLFPGDADTIELLDRKVGRHLKIHKFKMRRLTDMEIWHRIRDRAVDEFSKTMSQFISRCRKSMISPDDIKTMIKEEASLFDLQIYFLKLVWHIYRDYLQMLSTNNEEDFDGLLIRAEDMVASGHYYWNRRAGSGDLRKIKYLFIDEYQDFSLLFYKLVSAIKNINSDVKLFCVGDDWQAINGFAGSDLRFFKEFDSYFTQAKRLTITSNRRSSVEIIRVTNQLMRGEGEPAKSVSKHRGEVRIAYINSFVPDNKEKDMYKDNVVTPALIRLINLYISQGKRVALLCRRRGLPWYTPYDNHKGLILSRLLNDIRMAFPEEKRSMIVAMDTVHSYKGKEEEVIIIVDAVRRSYPLIHPRYMFFQVLGDSLEEIVSEEKRLFYVALSRAKNTLIILTEIGNQSPFLRYDIQDRINIRPIDINKLRAPKRRGTRYEISVFETITKSGATYVIKDFLSENSYRWDQARRSWVKSIAASTFSKEDLLKESWIQKANNVSISVDDEFENCILHMEIDNGVITST